ncbi:hypothetical protein CDL15_Pgr011141 [Punica granatum]|uniref:Aminotransferase-like plant mobile domain-containing protein n=1 Tax=Punica granatum TaxID=22663 RepID=A0A218XMV3_PUNGR|nr:hypothetical protein CDL15_Pgr011141 [Punica granatum]PKI42139.1 hypothetical protein CRG98_037455 [Punica granatum]
MVHPTLCPKLDCPSLPGRSLILIWDALCLVDQVYVRNIVGDLPLRFTLCSADRPIDWTFLRTIIEFWDEQHVVFSCQGTELTPTIEESATLIQRSSSMQDIVEPNQYATIPGRLSDLLGISVEEAQAELRNG